MLEAEEARLEVQLGRVREALAELESANPRLKAVEAGPGDSSSSKEAAGRSTKGGKRGAAGRRKALKPAANAREVAEVAAAVLGDRIMPYDELKCAVNEKIRQQGKSALGIHLHLQRVLENGRFERTAEGWRAPEA